MHLSNSLGIHYDCIKCITLGLNFYTGMMKTWWEHTPLFKTKIVLTYHAYHHTYFQPIHTHVPIPQCDSRGLIQAIMHDGHDQPPDFDLVFDMYHIPQTTPVISQLCCKETIYSFALFIFHFQQVFAFHFMQLHI